MTPIPQKGRSQFFYIFAIHHNGSRSSRPRVNSSPRSTRSLLNSPGSTHPVHICVGDVTYINILACNQAFVNKIGTLSSV